MDKSFTASFHTTIGMHLRDLRMLWSIHIIRAWLAHESAVTRISEALQ